MDKKNSFNGFSHETFKFLMELEFNNCRQWFEENRQRYLQYVAEPFKLLVKELSSFMLSIDPGFETRAEIGKTISRIYRDVRFSKDKTPYRSSVWLTFRRVGRDWVEDPCFFFEITPQWYRFGMGFYTTSKKTLDRLRELIDDNDPGFANVKELYEQQNLFKLEGERYKRMYAGQKPEDILEWYQKKNIFFMRTNKIDEQVFDAGLVRFLKEGFESLVPFYRFLWRIKSEGEAK